MQKALSQRDERKGPSVKAKVLWQNGNLAAQGVKRGPQRWKHRSEGEDGSGEVYGDKNLQDLVDHVEI